MRRAGPCAAFASPMRSAIGEPSTIMFLFSPSRVTEMALSTTDDLPASMARLFEEASQESTSGVIVS